MSRIEKRECQELWAKNKYFVLAKSQKIYNQIRAYLKVENPDRDVLNAMIRDAADLDDDRGTVVNAFEHVWGYFKKMAEEGEKREFFRLLSRYKKGDTEKERVLAYLEVLLRKYPNTYLENSTLFDLVRDRENELESKMFKTCMGRNRKNKAMK